MGVAFVGLATIWLLFETDVVQTRQPALVPAASLARCRASPVSSPSRSPGRRSGPESAYAAAPAYTEPEPRGGEPDPPHRRARRPPRPPTSRPPSRTSRRARRDALRSPGSCAAAIASSCSGWSVMTPSTPTSSRARTSPAMSPAASSASPRRRLVGKEAVLCEPLQRRHGQPQPMGVADQARRFADRTRAVSRQHQLLVRADAVGVLVDPGQALGGAQPGVGLPHVEQLDDRQPGALGQPLQDADLEGHQADPRPRLVEVVAAETPPSSPARRAGGRWSRSTPRA